jgi:hypothetical protein
VKRFFRTAVPAALTALIFLSLALQIFHEAGDAHHTAWWEKIPGFFILFGFLGCLALIVLALGLGAFLRKSQRYYDDE